MLTPVVEYGAGADHEPRWLPGLPESVRRTFRAFKVTEIAPVQ